MRLTSGLLALSGVTLPTLTGVPVLPAPTAMVVSSTALPPRRSDTVSRAVTVAALVCVNPRVKLGPLPTTPSLNHQK